MGIWAYLLGTLFLLFLLVSNIKRGAAGNKIERFGLSLAVAGGTLLTGASILQVFL